MIPGPKAHNPTVWSWEPPGRPKGAAASRRVFWRFEGIEGLLGCYLGKFDEESQLLSKLSLDFCGVI